MKLSTSIFIVLGLVASSEAFAPGLKTSNHIVSARGGVTNLVLQSTPTDANDNDDSAVALPIPTNQVVQKVAVAGATGRTGKLVVEELLNRNVQVVGLVRSMETATEQLANVTSNSLLEIQQCDLTDSDALSKALAGCG